MPPQEHGGTTQSHACLANTLPAERHPQPCFYFLVNYSRYSGVAWLSTTLYLRTDSDVVDLRERKLETLLTTSDHWVVLTTCLRVRHKEGSTWYCCGGLFFFKGEEDREAGI